MEGIASFLGLDRVLGRGEPKRGNGDDSVPKWDGANYIFEE